MRTRPATRHPMHASGATARLLATSGMVTHVRLFTHARIKQSIPRQCRDCPEESECRALCDFKMAASSAAEVYRLLGCPAAPVSELQADA